MVVMTFKVPICTGWPNEWSEVRLSTDINRDTEPETPPADAPLPEPPDDAEDTL